VKLKIKKIGINLVKLGFSVGAIWYVISKISFKEVLEVFSKANIYFLIAAFIFLVISFIFSAFRQNLFLSL